MVISVNSDWLYPPAQSKEIVMALTANNIDVSYHELKSSYGHDAFLLEEGQLNYIINGFLSDILVRDVMTPFITKIDESSKAHWAASAIHECILLTPYALGHCLKFCTLFASDWANVL